MKKLLVLLVVLAITMISSMAFAELAVNGSIETRSRDFYNTAANPDATATRSADTQTRVRLIVDGKAGDAAKARIQIENDWDEWGRFESPMANDTSTGNAGWLDLREAWMDVTMPFGGLHLRGGHQLLQLGQGWFFRSQKYGSDAWVAYTDIGNLHLGLVDVKIDEGAANATDDVDAYVVVATYKISDTMKAGVDITNLHVRQAGGPNPAELMNISANFTGKLGPVDLKAQVDMQTGDDGGAPKTDFSGIQLVAQAGIALDPVTINATIATASGDDPATLDENEEYQAFLDFDPHYAFLYEYKVNTAATNQLTTNTAHTGFANTMAMGAGASFKLSPSLSLGADFWMLKASEDVALHGGTPSDDLGMEIDLKINWKLAENVTWNWTLGMFQPGDAYNTGATESDDITGIQGVLGVKF